jgi:hypothetical protein
MKRVALLSLCAIVLVAANLMAQNLEQRNVINVNFSDVIGLIGQISDSYYDAFSKRLKEGNLGLSALEVAQLKRKIATLTQDLKPFKSDSPLPNPELYKENEDALAAALQCQNCSGTIPDGGSVKQIKSRGQLQTLILARLQAISQLLPKDETAAIPQQTLFSIEVHFSYMRQIAIAFAKVE